MRTDQCREETKGTHCNSNLAWRYVKGTMTCCRQSHKEAAIRSAADLDSVKRHVAFTTTLLIRFVVLGSHTGHTTMHLTS
jgi:hypothetical protein